MVEEDGYVQNYIRSVTARASAMTMHLLCHNPQDLLQNLINQLDNTASSSHSADLLLQGWTKVMEHVSVNAITKSRGLGSKQGHE